MWYLMALLLFADLEQSLLSMEKLDRASPDIWPERICKFDHYKMFLIVRVTHLLTLIQVIPLGMYSSLKTIH